MANWACYSAYLFQRISHLAFQLLSKHNLCVAAVIFNRRHQPKHLQYPLMHVSVVPSSEIRLNRDLRISLIITRVSESSEAQDCHVWISGGWCFYFFPHISDGIFYLEKQFSEKPAYLTCVCFLPKTDSKLSIYPDRGSWISKLHLVSFFTILPPPLTKIVNDRSSHFRRWRVARQNSGFPLDSSTIS